MQVTSSNSSKGSNVNHIVALLKCGYARAGTGTTPDSHATDA
jgi:hypothetical protein